MKEEFQDTKRVIRIRIWCYMFMSSIYSVLCLCPIYTVFCVNVRDIGSVHVKFHGGAGWIYNLFKGRVEKAIKKLLNSKVI
jgi:hypothetical protein